MKVNDESDVSYVQARSRTLNGGLDASEMGRRSGEARREKKLQREERAEENALTFRQRLGVSLSKLTQAELDARVKAARPSELVRFADQAFGRPGQAEEDKATDPGLEDLTREQIAQLRAMLEDSDPARELSELGSEHSDADPLGQSG